MDIVRQRLHNQWLDRTASATVLDVVRWMGAVQAQEYIPSLWALGVRLGPSATKQTVEQALVRGDIVRTWLLRGTIHYIPANDAAWMIRLLGPRINRKYRSYYEKVDLHDRAFAQGREALLHTLANHQACTRKELYAAFEHAGIAEPSKRGRGSFILQYWAQEGLICFGPYRDKQQTFVLLAEHTNKSTDMSEDAALATLTMRYFASHGPATLQDFAWWSGLTAAEVRQGVALAGNTLGQITIDSKRYFLSANTIVPTQLKNSTLLLPCFDEYTIGYKDRSAVLDPKYMQQLGYAVNYNNILVDGRIVGTWKQTNDTPSVFNFVNTPPSDRQTTIEYAADQYRRFMNG